MSLRSDTKRRLRSLGHLILQERSVGVTDEGWPCCVVLPMQQGQELLAVSAISRSRRLRRRTWTVQLSRALCCSAPWRDPCLWVAWWDRARAASTRFEAKVQRSWGQAGPLGKFEGSTVVFLSFPSCAWAQRILGGLTPL